MTLNNIKFNDLGRKCLITFMLLVPIFWASKIDLGHATNRVSQEAIFQLGALVLYAVVFLENIYLSLFLIFSVILYVSHDLCGGNYLTNIFYGCIIYQVTYKVINYENVETVFKAILWFCFLSLVLMICQKVGYDPIFFDMSHPELVMTDIGFMGLQCFLGMFFVFALPFMLYFNPWVALTFAVPIYLSHSSICVLAFVVIFAIYLWWNTDGIKKVLAVIALIAMIVAGGFYINHDSHDNMMTNRFNVWKLTIKDAFREPIAGWGMDSFRHLNKNGKKDFNYFTNEKNQAFHGIWIPEEKKFMYPQGMAINGHTFPWDNAHNEFITLLFEFGVFGIILLISLAKDVCNRFIFYDRRISAIFLFFVGFSICSMAQFPAHVARLAVFLPIMLGIYYKLTDEVINGDLINA